MCDDTRDNKNECKKGENSTNRYVEIYSYSEYWTFIRTCKTSKGIGAHYLCVRNTK